jgi:hypothetical protein
MLRKSADSANSNRDTLNDAVSLTNHTRLDFLSQELHFRERHQERRREIQEYHEKLRTMHDASYSMPSVGSSFYLPHPKTSIEPTSSARSKMTPAPESNVKSSSHWKHPDWHTVIPPTASLSGGPEMYTKLETGLQLASAVPGIAAFSARHILSMYPGRYDLSSDSAVVSDSQHSRRGVPSSHMSRPLRVLLMSTFITGTVAQGHDPANALDWKQRAMASLTDAIAQYAFLIPPLIVLIFGGSVAWMPIKRQAEHTLAAFMLLMAILYGTIHVDPAEGATGTDRSVQTAVGILYLVFMYGYCRSIILTHRKGKGASAIASILGLTIGCGCLLITPIRDFVKSFDHSPACVIPLALPLGFFICDVIWDIEKAGGRRKNQDDEESNLGRDGGAIASQTSNLPNPTPTSRD